MFPGAQRMNRGNHEIPALVQACRANNVTDLVIVHETRGQPGTTVSSFTLTLLCLLFYNSPNKNALSCFQCKYSLFDSCKAPLALTLILTCNHDHSHNKNDDAAISVINSRS